MSAQGARWFVGAVPGVGLRRVAFADLELGRVFTPPAAGRLLSLPGVPARRLHGPGELGVFVARQHRPRREAGVLRAMELVWLSITHNERVDRGAAQQDIRCFGSGGAVFTAVAVANAVLTKNKADESLGTTTADVTTNEFTTLGLARAAGSLGTYTAPSSLGGQFSRVVTRTFTATGNATARGAGLFDSVTVSGSKLYVEDNFSSDAVLVANDTLTVNITITN
jgi:hypothetical protein